ncbi:MAG: N-glycosylase/DNA lyase [Acidobacteriota bacterium]
MVESKRTEKEPVTVAYLKAIYPHKRDAIRARLAEFQEVFHHGDDARIFEELVFCIFTAGASARMGLKCIERVRPLLLTGDEEEIFRAIEGAHLYPHDRARYIVSTRNYLQRTIGLRLREQLTRLSQHQERRDYWAANREIKGIGYKEASHFLRNIGYCGYAILDKHILRSLHELRVIESPKPPTNKKKYLEIESLLQAFANEIEIDFDELDLLLWSNKTGEILK